MPVTFRTFLQGVAASMPQLVALKQQDIENQQRERVVKVQETTGAAQVKSAEADAAMSAYQLKTAQENEPLAKESAQLDVDIKRANSKLVGINNKIAEYNLTELQDPNSITNKTKRQELNNLIAQQRVMSAQVANLAAERDRTNAQNAAIGIETRRADLSLRAELLKFAVTIGKDKAAQRMFDPSVTFKTNDDLMKYFFDNQDQFTPDFINQVSGLWSTVQTHYDQAVQNAMTLASAEKSDKKRAGVYQSSMDYASSGLINLLSLNGGYQLDPTTQRKIRGLYTGQEEQEEQGNTGRPGSTPKKNAGYGGLYGTGPSLMDVGQSISNNANKSSGVNYGSGW